MSAHIQPSSAHTQTHKQSKQEQSEPCWQRMVQLCIKEDTEVRNYSNCASCHNSNMAMHMLFLINQETATFASAPSCILATGENNLTKLVTTQKQKKNGSVYCKQQIPLEFVEWSYDFTSHGLFIATKLAERII